MKQYFLITCDNIATPFVTFITTNFLQDTDHGVMISPFFEISRVASSMTVWMKNKLFEKYLFLNLVDSEQYIFSSDVSPIFLPFPNNNVLKFPKNAFRALPSPCHHILFRWLRTSSNVFSNGPISSWQGVSPTHFDLLGAYEPGETHCVECCLCVVLNIRY